MVVRQIVEQNIRSHGPSSIHASKFMRKTAEQVVEKKQKEWMQAREKALMHRLTRSYGVAIFGSARLDEKSEEFQFVKKLTKTLVSERRIDIVTGGGPGIMMAAHKGAKDAIAEAAKRGTNFKAHTYGINIELPFEQIPNNHIDFCTTHAEFSTRLQEFIDKTQGVYIAPGGFGTLLELAMVIQLKQVGHLNKDYPILVHPFWKPVFAAIYQEMYQHRKDKGVVTFFSPEDLQLIEFTDNIARISATFIHGYDKWHQEFKSRVRKATLLDALIDRFPIKKIAPAISVRLSN